MLGYEIIKTIELEKLKERLVSAMNEAELQKGENELLRFEIKVLDKTQKSLTRKRVVGKFTAKVKMFEPFKMRVNPYQSAKVQKILFAEGERWSNGKTEILNTEHPYLLLIPVGITFATRDEPSIFDNYKATEITYRQFMRIYSPKIKK